MKKESQSSSDLPNIGKPAQRALENEGYYRLIQLTKTTEAELLKIHGMGPKAIGILKDTLETKGLSFATSAKAVNVKKVTVPKDKAEQVNAYMEKLDHPFKAEVQFLRKIIKKVNKDIAEEWKWNAPSYSYHGNYLVTFNLWEKGHIQLVFHNPMISKVKNKLLEGEYKDRRMIHFADMKAIKVNQTILVKALKDLIKLQRVKKVNL